MSVKANLENKMPSLACKIEDIVKFIISYPIQHIVEYVDLVLPVGHGFGRSDLLKFIEDGHIVGLRYCNSFNIYLVDLVLSEYVTPDIVLAIY